MRRGTPGAEGEFLRKPMVGGPSPQGRDPEVPGEDVVKQKLTVLPRPERGRGGVSRTDPRRYRRTNAGG